MDCTLDGWWGFLWFFPATMLIRKLLTEYRVRGVCAAIVHSVILRQSSRFSGVRLGDFCFRIARYVSIALGFNFLACVFVCGLWQLFGFAFTFKIKPLKVTTNVLPEGWVQKPGQKIKPKGGYGKIMFCYLSLSVKNL